MQPVHAPLRHYYLLSQNSSTNVVAHFHWALSLLRSFCAPTCQPQLFMSPQGSGHLWLASPRWNILGVCSTKSNKTSTKHSETPFISTSWMIWMPVHGHSKAELFTCSAVQLPPNSTAFCVTSYAKQKSVKVSMLASQNMTKNITKCVASILEEISHQGG